MGDGSAERDYEREYAGRRYRIGEFAAMTGMSASRIRFYERAGLFPGQKEENGYRYFTARDAFRANAFRVLLQYGFTVEQAIDMIDARQNSADFRCSLVAQHEALRRQAELLRYRTERIERALELIELSEGGPDGVASGQQGTVDNLQAGAGFAVVDMEDWVYVEASRGSDFSISVDNAEVIAHFYSLLNVTHCVRLISTTELLGEGPTVTPSYAIAMRAHEAWRIDEQDRPRVRRLVMGKCLCARRMLTRAQSLHRESYEPMLDYLRTHGYRARGDGLLLPGFLNLDGEGSDVETIYLPIS